MLRSVAAALLLAVAGTQAIRDGDFGEWTIVAGEQVCDPVWGTCRQQFEVSGPGDAANKIPALSATCHNLGGCTFDKADAGGYNTRLLELKDGCVPASLALFQTVENSTNRWAAWGSAPWVSGKVQTITIPITKLHVYGE